MRYRTVILSDLHLGSKSSRRDDIIELLDMIECDNLFLNGDIVDGWALKRGSKWKDKDTKIVRKILKMAEKGTNVVWIKGNHDDFLTNYLALNMGNFTIKESIIYKGINKRRYYIFHGDVLDVFSNKFSIIAKIGSVGYDLALWLNRWYNVYREWIGLPYYSLSKIIKDSVKAAVSYVGDFENRAVKLANNKNCDAAICGHIHTPKLTQYYMNSGDWCENCTALVEDEDGVWNIITIHSVK
jgi:UDP-2,3-diacylglucosamine pyrophosphatase LpxH